MGEACNRGREVALKEMERERQVVAGRKAMRSDRWGREI